MSIEIMVALTLVDDASLADMRQQPRSYIPLYAARDIAATLRTANNPGSRPYAHNLADSIDKAIADACALQGVRLPA
jgi:hypothetical protein